MDESIAEILKDWSRSTDLLISHLPSREFEGESLSDWISGLLDKISMLEGQIEKLGKENEQLEYTASCASARMESMGKYISNLRHNIWEALNDNLPY